MYSIEELPPPPRRPIPAKPEKPARVKRSVPVSRLILALVPLLVLVTVGAGWIRIEKRITAVERNLTGTVGTLDEASSSLRLLWATTTRLDSTQAARQDLLRDSIGFVGAYVEAEVDRLWQTAYLEHEQRLDQTAKQLATSDRSIRQLTDAAGTTNSRLDALIGQNRALQSELRTVGQTATALQQTLNTLAGQLGNLQADLSAYSTMQVRLAGRVDGVERWVSPYREQALTADAISGRLASLASDLRRVSQRVDSLRTRSQTGISPPR